MTIISRFKNLNRLQLEITFKADEESGLIILLGKPIGNFIAIFLRKLYIELIYKFEQFSNNIIYPDPIDLQTWNTIKIYHIKSHGYIILNDVHRIHFTNNFSNFSINNNNIVEKIYVGGLPKKTKTLSAFLNIGFTGCISRLVLQNEIINLSKSRAQTKGIIDCNPCSNSTCNFNEFCIEKNAKFGHVCICTTKTCISECSMLEQAKCSNISDKLCSCHLSKYKYGLLRDLVIKNNEFVLNITIEIHSDNNSSIIILTDIFNESYKFLSLAIINMKIHFVMGLDPFLSIQSNKTLSTELSYNVYFGYISNQVFLKVDNEKEQRLFINPPTLNTTNLYFLAENDFKLISAGPKLDRFQGCISKVSVTIYVNFKRWNTVCKVDAVHTKLQPLSYPYYLVEIKRFA